LKARHWKKLKEFMGCPDFDPDDEGDEGYFGKLYERELNKYTEIILDETEKAQKQYKIFEGLEEIDKEWEDLVISVVPHKKETGEGFLKIIRTEPI
jgi:hypothetical protein